MPRSQRGSGLVGNLGSALAPAANIEAAKLGMDKLTSWDSNEDEREPVNNKEKEKNEHLDVKREVFFRLLLWFLLPSLVVKH